MQPNAEFLFGAVYILEQDYPPGDLERDLRLMREAGYNLVTFWPVANPWLSRTTRDFCVSHTRRALDLCQELGMRAILQLFGQNQAQEGLPDACLKPDMFIQDEDGKAVNQNCFWANLNHPGVRRLMDRYFKKVMRELRDHPALYGWDVFNEAHFRSDDRWTLKLYQRWLKQKYGTIRNLNLQWYRRYGSFSQVRPEKRKSAYSIWSSLLPDLDYEHFRSQNLTEICAFLAGCARRHDPWHPVIIDGTSSQILYGKVIERNNDEFATARVPDIYGGTFYPKSWGRNLKSQPWMQSLYFSVPACAARAAGRPYAVNELQTHTQSALTPGSEVSPQELVNWIWMCIFTGASIMQLWRWRPFLHGYQVTGRGLTRLDGTPNQRGAAVADLVGLIKKHSALFAHARTERPVVRLGIGYRARLLFDSLHKWAPNNWPQEVAGWYRVFWELGLNAELTDLDSLGQTSPPPAPVRLHSAPPAGTGASQRGQPPFPDPARIAKETPLFVLPGITALSAEAVAWLESYVQAGGLLIADARLGVVDPQGVAPASGVPGPALAALFGLRELDVGSGGHYHLNGQRLRAAFLHQELETFSESGAEVLARMENGGPALVYHRVGKGATLYWNSFVGVELAAAGSLSKPVDADAAMALATILAFLRGLIARHCPSVRLAAKADAVHLAFLESGAQTLVLAVNSSDAVQECTLSGLPAGAALVNLADDSSLAGTPAGLANLSLPPDCAQLWVYGRGLITPG